MMPKHITTIHTERGENLSLTDAGQQMELMIYAHGDGSRTKLTRLQVSQLVKSCQAWLRATLIRPAPKTKTGGDGA